MNRAGSLLPAGYEALEPFVERWAIGRAALRAQRRSESGAAERQAFYDAAKGLVSRALEDLDAKPIAEFADREQRLFQLMMSLAHVSLAVEGQGEVEPKHAALREHMRLTRVHSDPAA